MIKYVAPTPDVTDAVPARLAPALDKTYIAPASPRVNRDFRVLVNPQFSIFAVEGLCATSRWVSSCRGRVCSARLQASPSGTSSWIEVPNKNTPIPHCIVAPTPAREGPSRWKRHLAAQVPVIEHVTPAPDAAASAPECGSSSSSSAHAALTRTDSIDEKLTNMFDMLDSYKEIFSPLVSQLECRSSSSSAAHAAPVQAPSKRRRRTQYATLPGVLQDAVFLAPDAWPPVRHA